MSAETKSYLLRASKSGSEAEAREIVSEGIKHYNWVLKELLESAHPGDYPLLVALLDVAVSTVRENLPAGGDVLAKALRSAITVVAIFTGASEGDGT